MAHPKLQSIVGYCTNVHAGADLTSVRENLEKYSLDVKRQVRPDTLMGIGLWLSHTACHDLLHQTELHHFADWLAEQQLLPFTFNGFPYSNFHQAIVKHDVYQPNWADPKRLQYTCQLAHIQQRLLQAQNESTEFATLSTLPLGWPSHVQNTDFKSICADQLITLSEELDQIFEQTGTRIMVCIEPEPGCILDTAEDVCQFFEQYLLAGEKGATERIGRHIGVCHDVCHSSVMFESQSTALDAYAAHEIEVGKFQISSAIEANFKEIGNDNENKPTTTQIRQALKTFSEPRYLHQTMVQAVDDSLELHDDLPLALAKYPNPEQTKWRVHFHVPLFANKLGSVDTTQTDIKQCLEAIHPPTDRPVHFELETYAWTVLPEALQVPLAKGITREIEWFDELLR